MSKIRIVLLLSLFVLSGFVAYGAILGKSYVTPESFGAKGDGVTDDSPAISKCLQSGKTIRFTSGKNYLLKSALRHSNSDELRIDGNGAKLTISRDFAVKDNCAIFYFSNPRKKLLEVKNLDILCLLDQKFPDKEKRGDTYIFLVESCENVRFDNVNFKSEKLYNNVSFLRDNGSQSLRINRCKIVINTLSVQGGILWMMNKRDSQCTVTLNDSYFEHDAKDECMCFAVDRNYNNENCKMDIKVKNCEFYSKGEGSSSGFILVYSNSKNAYSNIDVKYEKCSFKTDGEYTRRIQGYQICNGDSDYNYGVFHTTYDQCKFDFKFKSLKEIGLAGLLYTKGTSMDPEAISYTFNDCEFDLKNVSPLIDNKNVRKGCYEFNDCKVISDGTLFTRKKEYKNSDVRLKLNNCDLKSNDEVLSTEKMSAKNCRFVNKMNTSSQMNEKNVKIENCTINKVVYK